MSELPRVKLIIAGSREVTDYNLVHLLFLDYLNEKFPDLESYVKAPLEIVSGGARGVDSLGEKLAAMYDLPLKVFPADWNTYGKSAGYERNVQMADYADELLAIWDGESKGTKHMIDIMANKNKTVLLKVIK